MPALSAVYAAICDKQSMNTLTCWVSRRVGASNSQLCLQVAILCDTRDINSVTCSVSRWLRASRVPALSAVCCSVKVLLNWEVRMPDSNPSSSTTRLASSANLCCSACHNTDSTVWRSLARVWQHRLWVTDTWTGQCACLTATPPSPPHGWPLAPTSAAAPVTMQTSLSGAAQLDICKKGYR